MRNITQVQRESIMLDAAVVFADFGETSQREIGITKGGVEFNVTENVRDIEYDGRRGKTKGMEVVDTIDAYLKFTTLELTQANIAEMLAASTISTTGSVISNTEGGVVPAAHYLKNVTAFGKCNKSSTYKKITLFNASGAGGLTIKTTDKGEATIDIQFDAHWDPEDYTDPIYTISDDTTGPA